MAVPSPNVRDRFLAQVVCCIAQDPVAAADETSVAQKNAGLDATANISADSAVTAPMAANETAAARPKAVGEWTMDDVREFFTDIKLGDYYNATITEFGLNGSILEVAHLTRGRASARESTGAR